MRPSFSAVMFHHFHGGVHPLGQGSISADEFEKIILGLKNEYTISDAGEWTERFLTNSLGEKEICLSFDDNLKCQFDIALPVLDKYAIKSFWFLYTSPYTGTIDNVELYRYFRSKYFTDFSNFFAAFIRNIPVTGTGAKKVQEVISNFSSNNYFKEYPYYSDEDRLYRYLRDIILTKSEFEMIMNAMIKEAGMDVADAINKLCISKEQIRQLSDEGHIIGLHSHSHPFKMENLSPADQLAEFTTNKQVLESILGNTITTVSYPCGSYSTDTISVLKEMGVTIGFKDSAGYLPKADIALEQPRLDHCYLIKQQHDS